MENPNGTASANPDGKVKRRADCSQGNGALQQIRGALAHSRAKGSARLVLVILATFSDTKHCTWPAVATIARMANLSERQVQTDLRKLVEELNELEIVSPGGGRNRPTLYRITLHTCSPFQLPKKVKSTKGVSREKLAARITGQTVNTPSPEGLIHGANGPAQGSLEEFRAYAASLGLSENDGEYLFEHFMGNGWKTGGNQVHDWKAIMRSWKAAGYLPSQKAQRIPHVRENPNDIIGGKRNLL
jgi:hypothetical protein